MRRFLSRSSILKRILIASACTLAAACAPGPVALAQHVGGHSSGAHAGTPHVIAPPGFYIPPRRPIYPMRPVFRFGFGVPFFGFGMGLGFNSFWWSNCGPFWGWGFGCNGLPFYDYGYGNYGYVYSRAPLYIYGERRRDLAQLYLKDGTVYNVTDYWLVNDQLHFTTLDESGTKWIEHVIDFDQLDLQKSIDVSTQRGFRFVLRNEPLQQYLQDHQDIGASGATPPQP
jgi:hypothetical protein